MKRILVVCVLCILCILSSGAHAQGGPGTMSDFARCAAMAKATALQYRDIIKDMQAAQQLMTVAKGYHMAAIYSADASVTDPQTEAARLVDAQTQVYAAQLKTPESSANQLFPADAARCAEIEQQAAQILEKAQTGQGQ